MSISKDIMNLVHTRLLNVTKANGYDTDCGLKVFNGRRRLDETHLPCIVIIETDSKVSAGTRTNVQVTSRYVIEGHSECDPDNPNDKAHDIISDIKRILFSNDIRFGGKVREMIYKSQNIAPREDGLSIVSASVEIDLVFSEDLTSP
jgi:hypothetical protein